MAGEPQPRSWCRVAVQVSLIPPSPGRIISIERSERTVRATVCAPKPVVLALTVAAFGNQPWFTQAVKWVRQFLGC